MSSLLRNVLILNFEIAVAEQQTSQQSDEEILLYFVIALSGYAGLVSFLAVVLCWKCLKAKTSIAASVQGNSKLT